MTADELTYDEDTDSIIATGNVEVAQGERVLRAARIRYRQSDGVVTATGDVALREPGGEVLFADSVELTGDLRSGVIRRLSVLLTDNSRIVAGGARRFDGNRTVMRKAVFSPCELCADEPARAPLWQLKAGTVVHDQADHDLTYYDASLEFFGVPVFYTPYFRHPDPSVTRQSGFLSPLYRSSRALGADVTIPYHWSIAPHRDATFLPRFTSEEGVVLAGEYRERTRDGEFAIDASITQASTAAEDGQQAARACLRPRASSISTRTWRWGFNLERALDDTYLNRYDISSEDELVTTLFAEQYSQRSFLSGRSYLFQSLRAGEQSDQSPIVLPLLEASLVTAPDYAGGYATLDGNLMILERLDGTDSRRLSIAGGWHRPMILAGGHLIRIDASLRGDLYHAYTPVDREHPSGAMKSDTTARFLPQLAVEWRYPLISRLGSIRQLIEPIMQGVVSPDGGNSYNIPNEDSRDLEFDHTNLFSTNRFTGLDRIETGRRINYGVRLGFFGPEGRPGDRAVRPERPGQEESAVRTRQRARTSALRLCRAHPHAAIALDRSLFAVSSRPSRRRRQAQRNRPRSRAELVAGQGRLRRPLPTANEYDGGRRRRQGGAREFHDEALRQLDVLIRDPPRCRAQHFH